MGILADYAKKWMGWQKDQADVDVINAQTAKNKARIAAAKKQIAVNAAKMDPQKVAQQAQLNWQNRVRWNQND